MKRILCLMAVLLMCVGLVAPAYAAEGDFVPSVSRPDGPGISNILLTEKEAMDSGEGVGSCVVVSTTKDAEEKTTDIYQEDRDLLLEIYEQLADGTMKLPLEGNYVVLELLDVSWRRSACVEAEHTHKPELKTEPIVLVADFDLGVEASAEVAVLIYVDEAWEPIEKVTNNGDGTVTCVLQDICPVAFCLPGEEPPAVTVAATMPMPEPGSEAGYPWLWLILLLLAFLLFLLLVFLRHKRKKEEEEKM